MRVTGLRCEHRIEALGIGVTAPRLSWKVETAARDWSQAAYEIEITRGSDTWRSGRMESDAPVLVPWPGPPLVSREPASVGVRAYAIPRVGHPIERPIDVEAGLLHPADWSARFVTPDGARGSSIDLSRPTSSYDHPGFERSGSSERRGRTTWANEKRVSEPPRERGAHRQVGGAARSAATRLPVDVSSPGRARRFLRERLSEWGMTDLADSAELMVSELVTNAIVHAHSPAMLVARDEGGTLHVEVEDWGAGVCTLRDPDVHAHNGRGLWFVDALAYRWGTASTARGKSVWFELARS